MYIQGEIVGEVVEDARRRRVVTLAVLAALMLVGAALRLWNLGGLPFIVDEGFHALAVEGLLKHGVPRLKHGQLYWRAPLFTYLQGGSAALFGLSEFALRLPAAVFGILAIPMGYLLARDLVDRRVGLVVAALLSLSLWEIELSRYARFYTLFQLLFMLGVWSFYWGFLRDRWWARATFIASALVALSIHDLAVMLGTLFLIVLPMRAFTPRRKALYALLPIATIIAWRLVQTGSKAISEVYEAPSRTRPVGGEQAATGLAAAISRKLGQPIKLPEFEFVLHAWQHHPWWFAFLALGVGLTLGGMLRWIAKARRRPPIDPAVAETWAATDQFTRALQSGFGAAPQAKLAMGFAATVMGMRRPQPPLTRAGAAGRFVLGGGMVVAAALHQGSLALLLGLLYLACFVRSWRGLLERPFVAGATTAINLLLAWCVYLMATDLWGWRDAPWQLLKYPDLNFYFLQWMRAGWPVVLLGGVLGSLILIRRAREEEMRTPEALGAWVVLGSFLLPIFAMGVMDWRWGESRYTFHVYPLLLTMYALLFVGLARLLSRRGAGGSSGGGGRVFAIAGVLAVLLSLDASPWNSLQPALRDHTSVREPTHAVINRMPYAAFHQDQRTPARYVRERLTPEDRVVLLGMPHQAAVYRYYAGQADIVVCPKDTYAWLIDAGDKGWVDAITYARVVSDMDDLRRTIGAWHAEGRRVWVLGDRLLWAKGTYFFPPAMEQTLPGLVGEAEVFGLDGMTFAAVLPPPVSAPPEDTPVER